MSAGRLVGRCEQRYCLCDSLMVTADNMIQNLSVRTLVPP